MNFLRSAITFSSLNFNLFRLCFSRHASTRRPLAQHASGSKPKITPRQSLAQHGSGSKAKVASRRPTGMHGSGSKKAKTASRRPTGMHGSGSKKAKTASRRPTGMHGTRSKKAKTASSKSSKPKKAQSKARLLKRKAKAELANAHKLLSRSRSVKSGEKPLEDQELRPAVLAERITLVCSKKGFRKGFEISMEMMRAAPKEAKTIEVWNTLLSRAFQARSYRLGYRIYLQMKLRGYIPNTTTYKTMFKYLSYIEGWDWGKHTKMLDRINNLYASYCDYANGIKSLNPSSDELTPVPSAQYILFLGKSGFFDKAMETFHLMDDTGPLSPDHSVYTSLFQIIGRRTGGMNTLQVSEQNAKDVKYFWKEMERKVNDGLIKVDSHTLTSALNVLRKGGREEQEFALGLVGKYLQLDDSETTLSASASIDLSPWLIQAVLLLYETLGKHELCEQIIYQIKSKQGAPEVLDYRNMELLFQAYSSMPSSLSDPIPKRTVSILSWMLEQGMLFRRRLLPTWSTYLTALVVCWRHRDWESALKVYELMTGVNVQDSIPEFSKIGQRAQPHLADGKLPADPITFSYLTRIARVAGDKTATLRCIRLFEFLGGVTNLLARRSFRHGMEGLDEKTRQSHGRYLPYCKKMLAEHVIELYTALISGNATAGNAIAKERKEWHRQRELAEIALGKFDDFEPPKGQNDRVLEPKGDTQVGVLPEAVIFQQSLDEEDTENTK